MHFTSFIFFIIVFGVYSQGVDDIVITDNYEIRGDTFIINFQYVNTQAKDYTWKDRVDEIRKVVIQNQVVTIYK